nr:hepatocyte cell adhesion molecule-like [Misgurnus anguillicaudatus]
MFNAFNLVCFCLLVGVFGKTEVKLVIEGDSVTLHTDLTEIQRDKEIEWWFKNTCIAKIKRSEDINPIYDENDKTQRLRLKLNNQTGDLTITDIRSEDSGLYRLNIFIGNNQKVKDFSLTAYAPLVNPVITNDLSQCSISHCALLCSVLNVRDVSLSWYKGNSLLSSINVSDFKISLSLPLEVETQDNNTYSCVLNNPITNRTQHLNIKDICWLCSDVVIVLRLQLAVLAATGMAALAAVIVLGYDIKSRRAEQKRKQTPTTSIELDS